jgi:hypothetical protein
MLHKIPFTVKALRIPRNIYEFEYLKLKSKAKEGGLKFIQFPFWTTYPFDILAFYSFILLILDFLIWVPLQFYFKLNLDNYNLWFQVPWIVFSYFLGINVLILRLGKMFAIMGMYWDYCWINFRVKNMLLNKPSYEPFRVSYSNFVKRYRDYLYNNSRLITWTAARASRKREWERLQLISVLFSPITTLAILRDRITFLFVY